MKYKWTKTLCAFLSILLLTSVVYAAENMPVLLMEAEPMPEPASPVFPVDGELSMMAQAQEESQDEFYFANGRPVTIRLDGTTTCVFDDVNGEKLKELSPNTWVFGGAREEDCTNTSVTMESGTLKGIYGGGGITGKVTGTAKVVFTGGKIASLYGGGSNAEAVTGNTEVIVDEGAEADSVFGGGDKGAVTGMAAVTVNGGTIVNICGGGNIGTVESTKVRLKGGRIEKNACGGGRMGAVTTAALTLEGSSVEFIFGGGEQADVTEASVVVKSGTVRNIYGGALQEAVAEKTSIIMEGGSANYIYGGGKDAATGTAEVQISGGRVIGGVYGGGETGKTDTASVTISGGTDRIPEVCGGSGKGLVSECTVVLKDSGTVGTLYGGGKESASSNISITVEGGTASRLVCANGVTTDAAEVSLRINGGEIDTIRSGSPANLGGNGIVLAGGTVWEIEEGITVKDEAERMLFPVDLYVKGGDGNAQPDVRFSFTINDVGPERSAATNDEGYFRMYLPEGEAVVSAEISGNTYPTSITVAETGENLVEITLSGVTLHDSGDGTTVRFHDTGIKTGDLVVAAKYVGGKMSDVDTAVIESGAAAMKKGIGNGWKLFVMSASYAPLCEPIELS